MPFPRCGYVRSRTLHHLECDDELAALLPRQVHVAELALPERFADVEIIQ